MRDRPIPCRSEVIRSRRSTRRAPHVVRSCESARLPGRKRSGNTCRAPAWVAARSSGRSANCSAANCRMTSCRSYRPAPLRRINDFAHHGGKCGERRSGHHLGRLTPKPTLEHRQPQQDPLFFLREELPRMVEDGAASSDGEPADRAWTRSGKPTRARSRLRSRHRPAFAPRPRPTQCPAASHPPVGRCGQWRVILWRRGRIRRAPAAHVAGTTPPMAFWASAPPSSVPPPSGRGKP